MQQDGQPAEGVGPGSQSEQGAGAPLPIGQRLRAAREAAGLARDELARRAHIPAAVLADLEDGRGERLGAAVFVRGYLRSAARAIGLADDAFLDAVPVLAAEAPVLVPQRVRPATPRWVVRYATPVAYALLTAVVMVPLVYLARPSVQGTQASSLTSIDGAVRGSSLPTQAAPALDFARGTLAASPAAAPAEVGPPLPPPVATPLPSAPTAAPVMASLAPLPQQGPSGTSRRVTLRLAAASWVEFTGADGSRLEYALLPAGTQRDYQLAGSADLRIGNASEAQLTVDGRVVDLRPLSSSNDVARVQLGDPPTPAAD